MPYQFGISFISIPSNTLTLERLDGLCYCFLPSMMQDQWRFNGVHCCLRSNMTLDKLLVCMYHGPITFFSCHLLQDVV